MESLWEADIKIPEFPPLPGDVSTDVLIIGGGMTGILCALELDRRGISYILLEARRIGSGTTRGTTAVLTAQHSALYSDMAQKFGMQKAGQYLEANLCAVQRFRELSEKYPCDFEEKRSYMYANAGVHRLEREVKTLAKLGFSAEFVTNTPLPFYVDGAVRYPGMAQFHPLKFIAGAAKRLKIYENTFVRRIDGDTAWTDHGKVRAKAVIMATRYPFLNRYGLYFMKLYQIRSFVTALEGGPDVMGTYVDASERGAYFRNYKNYLVAGGGDHRTGTKAGGFPAVFGYVKRNFPGCKISYSWAAQDSISLDGIPYIGRYSPKTPDLYVATGFNEWGMTSAMAASAILADMITGVQNSHAPVFSPNRSMWQKQLFMNLGETFINFILPTAPRCTHLGCSMRWNKEDRTWDCPCHGSRFDEHGKLIDNPAMRDLKPR